MAANRDNFPQSVKEKARMRVGSRCSNPSCRVPTSGPSYDSPSAVNNIGKAAHISAAAPGGPRYDPNMQQSQRKSISNALWLCSNCADDIDNDTSTFTIEQLNQWKRQAERLARAELGTKLPSQKDSVDLLTSALSGTGSKFIPSAIHNVREATQNVLEALDPRFKVQISISDVQTHLTLLAKENVSGSLVVDPAFLSDFDKKYSNLMENGGEFSFSASAITLKGSKIFDELHPLFQGGEFKFKGPTKGGAIQRMIVFSDSIDTGELRLDDIYGEMAIGDKTCTFQGSIFDGIFQVSSTYLSKTKRVDTKYTVDLDRWKGRSIFDLPFFDKVYNCVLALQHAKSIDLALEVDGDTVFSGVSEKVGNVGEVTIANFHYLWYLFLVRKVLKEFNQKMTVSIVYDASIMASLEIYYNVLGGRKTLNISELNSFTASLTAEVDIEFFDTKPLETGMLLNISGPTLTIEDQIVTVPPLATVIHNLRTREGQKLAGIKAGETFEIVFDVTDETILTVDFASNLQSL